MMKRIATVEVTFEVTDGWTADEIEAARRKLVEINIDGLIAADAAERLGRAYTPYGPLAGVRTYTTLIDGD